MMSTIGKTGEFARLLKERGLMNQKQFKICQKIYKDQGSPSSLLDKIADAKGFLTFPALLNILLDGKEPLNFQKICSSDPDREVGDHRIYPAEMNFLNKFFRPHQRVPMEHFGPGVKIGKDLQILKLLNKGGMGAVFLAFQHSQKRKVAVKFLSPALEANKRGVARFEKEAEILSEFNHPNIVQCYGSGEEKSLKYIVLEYIEGERLADLIKKKKSLSSGEALEITLQVCKALKAAHEKGIFHRDVKPENIFITPEGVVKLGDFGIAKTNPVSSLTPKNKVLGTPYYMSPEQIRGKGLGPQSDLYSLGATLYHMLVGRPPFVEPSAVMVMYRHLKEPLHFSSKARETLKAEIIELLEIMMAKKKESRYSSANEVIRSIERILHKLYGAGERETSPTLTSAPSFSFGVVFFLLKKLIPSQWPRPFLIMLGVMAGLMILLTLAFFFASFLGKFAL